LLFICNRVTCAVLPGGEGKLLTCPVAGKLAVWEP
jgi:hypothetical protein